MKKRYKILLAVLVVFIALLMLGFVVSQHLSNHYSDNSNDRTLEKVTDSKQFNGQVFENKQARRTNPNPLDLAKTILFDKQQPSEPLKPINIVTMDKEQLIALQQDYKSQGMLFFRLGHSTVLMLIDGEYWLSDPVFAQRASPFSFIGPKRFHQPPISIAELPAIKGVIISHNHYDHLDEQAIKLLNAKVEHFYTPLGVGEAIIKWGVNRNKVTQLDWWQSIKQGSIELTSTPSQHFSGRSTLDRDSTLWSSWAIKGRQGSIFFSGDTGYSPAFKEIGEKLGPFDISFMETGAYNALWSDIHMFPEQSAQAHIDIKGKYLVPIHNGTFDLSIHTWTDPFERISIAAKALSVNLLTPHMGQLIRLQDQVDNAVTENAWWRE